MARPTLTHRRRWVAGLLLSTSLAAAPLEAQSSSEEDTRELLLAIRLELQELRERVDERLEAIDARLDALESQAEPEATDEVPEESLDELLREAAAALPSETQPAAGPAPLPSLNPQISVIGDFLGAASWDVPEPFTTAPVDLREVEIAFQSAIDPFARADFFVTIPSLEEVEIEEGYVTFLTLPSNFLVRLGKVRVPFGRANVDHRPETFTVDRPDVVRAYFGEEGLAEMGATVARLVPNPWDAFMELELDVLKGANETSFGGGELSDLLYTVRFSSFYDLTLDQNLNVGLSYANGVHDVVDDSALRTELLGLDLTYQWRPLRRGTYRSFLWQTELVRGSRDALGEPNAGTWGIYSLARYQLSRRWFMGGRIDRSESPDGTESARSLSAFVELFPSEFQRLRLQYKHSDFDELPSSHQLFFQWYYLIGTHGAHRF